MSGIAVNSFVDRFQQAFHHGDPEATAKPSEAGNVQLLQSIYQAIIDEDYEFFANMLAEDVDLEIIGTPSVPFLGSWQGRSQVAAAVRSNFGALDEQAPELLSVIAQGDTVVISGRERGRYKATGQGYDVQWVQFNIFEDGKLIRARQLVTDTRI